MKINDGRRLTRYYLSLFCVLINTDHSIICVKYTWGLKVFVWYFCMTASIIIIYSKQKLSYFSFLFPLPYMTKLEQKKFGSIVQILKQFKKWYRCQVSFPRPLLSAWGHSFSGGPVAQSKSTGSRNPELSTMERGHQMDGGPWRARFYARSEIFPGSNVSVYGCVCVIVW